MGRDEKLTNFMCPNIWILPWWGVEYEIYCPVITFGLMCESILHKLSSLHSKIVIIIDMRSSALAMCQVGVHVLLATEHNFSSSDY